LLSIVVALMINCWLCIVGSIDHQLSVIGWLD